MEYSDWTFHKAYVVSDTPKYLVELEEHRRGKDQMMFAHIDVRDWSLGTLKSLKHEFNLFRECVSCPLYACGQDDDAKWAAFVALFGFKPLCTVKCTDGKERRLFISLKDKNNNVIPTEADVVHDQRKSVERPDAVPAGRVQPSAGRAGPSAGRNKPD